MPESETQKILDEAERIRHDKPKLPKAPRQKKQVVTGDIERFRTWLRIRVGANNQIIFIIFILLMLHLSAIFATEFTGVWHEINFHEIFAAIYLTGVLFGIFDYIRFSSWRTKLPFELYGWNELVDQPHFAREYWIHTSISIKLHDSATEAQKKLIAAAFIIFTHRANKKYYSTDFSDGRTKWSFSELKASGSANNHVARELFSSLSRTFTTIQREQQCIVSVTITTKAQQFTVSAPTAD